MDDVHLAMEGIHAILRSFLSLGDFTPQELCPERFDPVPTLSLALRAERILLDEGPPLKNLPKAIGIRPKGQAAGAWGDSESISMGTYEESESTCLRLQLARVVLHSRYERSNKLDLFKEEHNKQRLAQARALKDQTRLHVERVLAYTRNTLKNLCRAMGISPKPQTAGASRDSESTYVGSYTAFEQENTSDSDSRVAKDNALTQSAVIWEVGSASTHHATGNRALLSDFKTGGDLYIQTGDGRRMPVGGHGSVITDTVVLPDVWFVPELKKNIVSVSQLAELDCSIEFKRDACYISDAAVGTIFGKALVGENGMFKLEFLKIPLAN